LTFILFGKYDKTSLKQISRLVVQSTYQAVDFEINQSFC